MPCVSIKAKINYTISVLRHPKIKIQTQCITSSFLQSQMNKSIFLKNLDFSKTKCNFFFTGDKTKSNPYYIDKVLLTLKNNY